MKTKMGIEGVGPRIGFFAAIYIVIAYFVNGAYPKVFIISNNPDAFNWLTILFFIIGLILWISSAAMMVVYFPKGKLITTGPFRIFLNPLYDSFILFLLPALALYLNSWIYFGASIVMLASSLTMGKKEERYLHETFGKEYEIYRKKVWFKL